VISFTIAGFQAYQWLKERCTVAPASGAPQTTEDLVLRLWAADAIPALSGVKLYKIINEVIRLDDLATPTDERPSALFSACVSLVCMMQLFLGASRRNPSGLPRCWPRGEHAAGLDQSSEAHVVWRGGGLPLEHVRFYEQLANPSGNGRVYRVPGLLASSFSKSKARDEFMLPAIRAGDAGVLWKIELVKDDDGGCKHVNFLGEYSEYNEKEFLFGTYSTFRVLSVTDQDKATRATTNGGIKITLRACVDNSEEMEDVPSAPWY